MRLNHAAACLTFAWLLSACASEPPLSASQASDADRSSETLSREEAEKIAERAVVVTLVPGPAADDDTICRRETVTGTHRPRTICRTRAERRAMRSSAQDWYRSGGRDGGISRVPTVH